MESQKQKLLLFLESINEDFSPPLTDKVSLEEYVNKIIENAELVLESNNEEICGLVVLYCNDKQSNRAYIPLCGVNKEFRGKGIAKSLMEKAILIVKKAGYHTLAIHSNNPIAINLYKKLGFKIIEGNERVYMELKIN